MAAPGRSITGYWASGPLFNREIFLEENALGRGGVGAVYAVADKPDSVAKVYHNPNKNIAYLEKIKAMLDNPAELTPIESGGHRYIQLAWPQALLFNHDSEFCGYVMPAIDLSRATVLENLLSRKARQAHGLPSIYGYRLSTAYNLASVVAELHRHGHHVIDLKPVNINVYKDNFYIAMLDCDGFSIRGETRRYPAYQYSDGYITPEALTNRLRPESLGENQDRFALAVILFQLLNNGLHPFQGIPAAGRRVPTTTGERIQAGYYAYGYTPCPDMKPSPWSIHEYLDDSTRLLFDRAFTSPMERPTARAWCEHLLPYIIPQSKRYRACRYNNEHAIYSKGCGGCAIEKHTQRLKIKQSRNPIAKIALLLKPKRSIQPRWLRRWRRAWLSPSKFKSRLIKTLAVATIASFYLLSYWMLAGNDDGPRRPAATGSIKTRVIDYIRRGDLAKIKKFVNPSELSTLYNNNPPIYYAVVENKYDIVEYLVSRGVALRTDDPQKRTLLHIAVLNADANTVSLLAKHKPDWVNLPDGKGDTPLALALKRKRKESVAILVKAGADITKVPPSGLLLRAAIRHGTLPEVKWLSQRMRPRYDDRQNHILDAVVSGNLQILNYVLKEKMPDYFNAERPVRIRQAGTSFYSELTRRALPLMRAIEIGHISAEAMVKRLHSHGLNINQQDQDGKTPLMLAALKNRPGILRYLLAKGAEVNFKDKYHQTALMHAVMGGCCVKQLLDRSADANVQNVTGYSALMLAVLRKNTRAVKLLVRHGADRLLLSQFGETALDQAKRLEYRQIASILSNPDLD